VVRLLVEVLLLLKTFGGAPTPASVFSPALRLGWRKLRSKGGCLLLLLLDQIHLVIQLLKLGVTKNRATTLDPGSSPG
jgi:hypothetical protein